MKLKCKCDDKFEFSKDANIIVNCHSNNKVMIPGLYGLTKICKNPLCEWSSIKWSRNI